MKRVPVCLAVFLIAFVTFFISAPVSAGCPSTPANKEAWKKCAQEQLKSAENRMAKTFNQISARLNTDQRQNLSASQAAWKRLAKLEAEQECATGSTPREICLLETMTEKVREREVMLKEGLW